MPLSAAVAGVCLASLVTAAADAEAGPVVEYHTGDPHDCREDLSTWWESWQAEKAQWCCAHRLHCPTVPRALPSVVTATATPTKQLSEAPQEAQEKKKKKSAVKYQSADPFDCRIGLATWWNTWDTWQRDWCCKNRLHCPKLPPTLTAAPSLHDCSEGLQTWWKTWEADKREYCCRHRVVCPTVLPQSMMSKGRSQQRGLQHQQQQQKRCVGNPKKWSEEDLEYCCFVLGKGCESTGSKAAKGSKVAVEGDEEEEDQAREKEERRDPVNRGVAARRGRDRRSRARGRDSAAAPEEEEEGDQQGGVAASGGRGRDRRSRPAGRDNAAAPAPSANVQPCLQRGCYFMPLNMRGESRTLEPEISGCRRRCEESQGCAHFSWWADSGCHLQDGYASRIYDPQASSGSPFCKDNQRMQRQKKQQAPRQHHQERSGGEGFDHKRHAHPGAAGDEGLRFLHSNQQAGTMPGETSLVEKGGRSGVPENYDCVVGPWEREWSPERLEWCCSNKNVCEGPTPPAGEEEADGHHGYLLEDNQGFASTDADEFMRKVGGASPAISAGSSSSSSGGGGGSSSSRPSKPSGTSIVAAASKFEMKWQGAAAIGSLAGCFALAVLALRRRKRRQAHLRVSYSLQPLDEGDSI